MGLFQDIATGMKKSHIVVACISDEVSMQNVWKNLGVEHLMNLLLTWYGRTGIMDRNIKSNVFWSTGGLDGMYDFYVFKLYRTSI